MMTPQELKTARWFGHLEVVAHRLKARYGHMPFYINAEAMQGFDLWRRLADSAWNLDGLGDECRRLRKEGKL